MKNKKYIIVSARIDSDTLNQLQQETTKTDRTLSYIINKILVEYLKTHKEN